MQKETEILQGIARLEEGVSNLGKRLDSMNGNIAGAHKRLDEHLKDDMMAHRALWASVSNLKVQDAKVGGVLLVVMLVFGAILAWALKG